MYSKKPLIQIEFAQILCVCLCLPSVRDRGLARHTETHSSIQQCLNALPIPPRTALFAVDKLTLGSTSLRDHFEDSICHRSTKISHILEPPFSLGSSLWKSSIAIENQPFSHSISFMTDFPKLSRLQSLMTPEASYSHDIPVILQGSPSYIPIKPCTSP